MENKQFNIEFIILDKDTKKKIVHNTWIVKESTYNEIMDLLRSKQELNKLEI